MPIEEISSVCFVGAGLMGCFNSLLAAAAGYDARLYDSSAEALASVPQRQQLIAAYLAWQQVLPPQQIEAGLRGVRTLADPAAAAAGADLLSESVPERLELKRDVHRQFDTLCPTHAILTTNTSSLLVSELDRAVARRDRFAALHSHLGALLFDVAGGPRTSPATIDILFRYVRSLGGTPLLLARPKRGYLSNTLIGALTSTAISLVCDGQRHPADVDRAWMFYEKALSGPFGLLDFVGLDVAFDVAAAGARRHRARAEQTDKIMAFLRPYLDRGHLGLKSGAGVYQYPYPAFLQPGFPTAGQADAAIHDALVHRLVAAALLLVIDGYAGAEDVDRTWTILMRSAAGPLGMLRRMGRETFLGQLPAQLRQGVCSRRDVRKLKAFLRDGGPSDP
jgi:3-hydroxybutyryl-CoA dehydrogenase